MSNELATTSTVMESRESGGRVDTVWSEAGFELAQRQARMLSQSSIVPAHIRGNVSDCIIAVQMAQSFGIQPVTVMRGMYNFKGTVGWNAVFLASLINTSGKLKAPLNYEEEGRGDSFRIRAFATFKGEDEPRYGTWISMEMAKKDGWAGRNSKYKSMPEVMLQHRATTFFIRRHAPEITMGMHTVEELEDAGVMKMDPNRPEIEVIEKPRQPMAEPAKEDEVIEAEFTEAEPTPEQSEAINEQAGKFVAEMADETQGTKETLDTLCVQAGFSVESACDLAKKRAWHKASSWYAPSKATIGKQREFVARVAKSMKEK